MFESQYLMTKDATTGIVVFSPWFPRHGDQIRYTLDLVQADLAKIIVKLFSKSTEETGDGGDTGSSIALTSTLGRTAQEFTTGLEELVRYQFTVKANTDGTLGWVLFRMLPPIWFDAVKP